MNFKSYYKSPITFKISMQEKIVLKIGDSNLMMK